MTEQMTPLRRRMLDDMTIRNMLPSTQKTYVRTVANFSIFHGRSPDKLNAEDVRDYRLHLITRGLKATSINPTIGALRFFHSTTLGQKHLSEQIPYARREDTLAPCWRGTGSHLPPARGLPYAPISPQAGQGGLI